MNRKCDITVFMFKPEGQYSRDCMVFKDQDPILFFYDIDLPKELRIVREDSYGHMVQIDWNSVESVGVNSKK